MKKISGGMRIASKSTILLLPGFWKALPEINK